MAAVAWPTAEVTNTVNIGNVSIRESLSDIISRVDPTDTPFFSSMRRRKAESHQFEWQNDQLNPVDTTARVYGTDYQYDTRKNPERRANYIQTLARAFRISDEEEAAVSAGFRSRYAHEIMKAGVEQKIDIENVLVKLNQAGDKPTAANEYIGKTASLLTVFETNVSHGTGTAADGGWNSGTNEYDARTAGTKKAYTETHLKDVLSKLWTNSGDIQDSVIMTNIDQKRKFNGFAGIADQRIMNDSMKQAHILAAADSYRSDFGVTKIILNRHMRAEDSFVIRPKRMMLKTYWMLRPKRLAVTGNNKKWGISSSFGLCVANEKEQALLTDLS